MIDKGMIGRLLADKRRELAHERIYGRPSKWGKLIVEYAALLGKWEATLK